MSFVHLIRLIHDSAGNQIHPRCFKLVFENNLCSLARVLVSGTSIMAVCFGGSESDAEEVSLQARATPNNTTTVNHWQGYSCLEWSRETTIAGVHGILPLTTLLFNIPHDDLADWMGKFVLNVCKDGSEYPPKSLYVCMLLFVVWNVLFFFFWGKWCPQRQPGFGKTTKWSTLLEKGVLSKLNPSLLMKSPCYGLVDSLEHSAKALVNTVYFYNCKVFGFRSYNEHRNLRCSQ